MAGLRFSTIQTKPTEILDLTSLTLDKFHILVKRILILIFTLHRFL
jgi:hypothetical protein